jgi:hypothetical protein
LNLPKRLLWGALAIVLVVATAYVYRHRAPKLTAKDTMVLADFANNTGEGVFDGALRQGLSAQLEQSPFLNLLSDRRVAQTLSLVAQPKEAHLTHDVAREVCQRTSCLVQPTASSTLLISAKPLNKQLVSRSAIKTICVGPTNK